MQNNRKNIFYYISLYIREINDSNNSRDRREQLELFHYYVTHVAHAIVQCYLKVNSNWCKYILQILDLPLKKFFKKV